MESSCLDLALEGERLCKAGDYRAGDLQILSAIYSQLGNAYFHLQEYNKALEYHRHDLTLTRTIGDELGEAKASGNLGNTLKLLGRYDEAVVCCQRHLEITRAIAVSHLSGFPQVTVFVYHPYLKKKQYLFISY
uniref:Uncharacterized protein n=1 Tax=Sander lucioperca TaxID=283035 RepID=A0A8D0AIY6_SANLU